MQYTKGYVGFIDILGFGKYVSEKNNSKTIKDLFYFINKFQSFFNESSLSVKIAFFSDTIILTVEEIEKNNLSMLFTAIEMAENYLFKHTQLYFRGAIAKGYYYNNDGIAFGPAIVSAYELEKKAKYSRIILDEDVYLDIQEKTIDVFKDFDGEYCYNTFVRKILFDISHDLNKENLKAKIKEERQLLCKAIKRNYNTNVAEKYLWRILPFNEFCDNLPIFLKELKIEFGEEELLEFKALKIRLIEFKSV